VERLSDKYDLSAAVRLGQQNQGAH